MKTYRKSLVVLIAVLIGGLLSSCTGAGAVNSYPGVSVGQDTVYLAYQNGVFAVNAKDGSLLWRFPEKPEGSKNFFAPPAVTNNQLVFGDYSNQVYAVDPKNPAAQKWTFNPGVGHTLASPLALDTMILVPSGDHHLYALSPDGKLLWKFQTGNLLWSTPATDGKTIYLSSMDHNLYALSMEGKQLWKKDIGSPLVGSPVVGKDGTVYVVTMNSIVAAFNGANGNSLWQSGPYGGEVWGSPVMQENALYFGSTSGKVFAVSTESAAAKRDLWSVDLGDPIIAGGALLKDGILFATENGSAYKVSFKGEKASMKLTVNGKLYSTPASTNDLLILAITQGDKALAAYDLNGNEKWSFSLPK